MRVDVVTIFPHMFDGVFDYGVFGQARKSKLIDYRIHNLRDYTTDKHQKVDDSPFGGGGGLIFRIEPLVTALKSIQDGTLQSRSVLLSPRGRRLTSDLAQELAKNSQLLLFCGRYEGVDERFSHYIDDEISIGDFVLSGGEIAAIVVMDAVARFVPGVVGQPEAPYQDSFGGGVLEHPYYTRPVEFEGKKVPDVLRSGNHEKIRQWRKEEAINTTLQRRPDLLKNSQIIKKQEQEIDDSDDNTSKEK